MNLFINEDVLSVSQYRYNKMGGWTVVIVAVCLSFVQVISYARVIKN